MWTKEGKKIEMVIFFVIIFLIRDEGSRIFKSFEERSLKSDKSDKSDIKGFFMHSLQLLKA